MATRNTIEAARALKAKWEREYPDRTFEIVDRSYTGGIGRGIAKQEGYEIVEDDGGCTVVAKVPQFAVLEVRKCRACGAKILTAAIGEDSLTWCQTCKEKQDQQWGQESKRRARQAAREQGPRLRIQPFQLQPPRRAL